ncbi:MAG: hypothetical protein SAL70_09655 [Scytonema sp. PMC 1070.18]|nr:hypothetical protein [Scytonema sp. PMC 1070.18]
MNNNIFNQEWNHRKVEADHLLLEANQSFEEALNSYKQALDIYLEISNNFVAYLISSLVCEQQIPTIKDTEDSEISELHLRGFNGMTSEAPIVKPPKKRR